MNTEIMEHAETLYSKLTDEQRKEIAAKGYGAAKPHVQDFIIGPDGNVVDEVALELCGLCQT
jgi:hypothetical protein